MDFWTEIGIAVLKILFVVLLVVGVFAPVLVWAERRQSAMIQDRVGPSRAAIPLPAGAVSLLQASLRPLEALSFFSFAMAGVALLLLVVLAVMGGPTVLGVTAEQLYLGAIGTAVLGGAAALGYRLHDSLARTGKITVLGLLHSAADALKMIFKEDFVPEKADKLLFALAPIIVVIPALVSFAVIPFADILFLDCATEVLPRDIMTTMQCGGIAATTAIPMQIASLNVGMLFIFAVAGTGIIGAAIAGYSSDNKFSLMGGIRAASQMVSYEVALGLTVVPCFMIYGSMRLEDMARWQHDHGLWGIFIPPLTLAAVLYSFAAIAETKRVPFDLPEGESELVGGYLTEYSGLKFGMFFTGEFVEVVALAALGAVLFLGGWDVPFLYRDGFDLPGTWEMTVPMTSWSFADTILLQHWAVVAIEVVLFIGKIIFLIWFQLMIRWTLPRFRYDQLMKLCWKGILPIALVNVLFTGLAILIWN